MIARAKVSYTSIATLALLALPLAAGAQQIDYARSQITVASRQMNVPVEAKFKKFSAQLAFDPAAPGQSRPISKSMRRALTLAMTT